MAMTIIELKQGYYGNLTGISKADALREFAEDDAKFLEQHPSCKPYHRPSWRVREVRDDEIAPWGHVWYSVDMDGRLQRHSANYDSS